MSNSNKQEGNNLAIGDVCRVVVDWSDDKLLAKSQCRITCLQHNGQQTFIRVAWIGKNAYELERDFGCLYGPTELRKVR